MGRSGGSYTVREGRPVYTWLLKVQQLTSLRVSEGRKSNSRAVVKRQFRIKAFRLTVFIQQEILF